jgi:two-component system cell cycle response regulator DivK
MRKTILIIEDNDINMTLYTLFLSKAGYSVIQSPKGKNGLDMIKEFLPDLVLTDINLPDISGIDIIKNIKSDSTTNHIPVVAISAFKDKDEEDEVKNISDATLKKPTTNDGLLTVVRAFLTA